MANLPPPKPFKRLLIANRGEIAIRILQAAAELPSPPETYALYTDNDSTHISLGRPHKALALPSPSSYMDISHLVSLAREHGIDACHPGYGFLSESGEFARRMWEEASCRVVGPGAEVLERTGDKLMAKMLARECGVPVLKAMEAPSSSVAEVARFAEVVGFPIMVKAVDGGGGRGIRLVRDGSELGAGVERCIGESPSGMVFAEQAAVEGFKHIEVQILGDGTGGVKHLWERDCSVQRRYQKIVEVAPSPPCVSRKMIAKVVGAAVKMAKALRYGGLGTWEFLVNARKREFFFLEINPRLQVEHTISECVAGLDLVKEQLLMAQGLQKENLKLGEWWEAETAPSMASIQLRLCAEDPANGFTLSMGKVTDIKLPSGNGVRVDTHLSRGGAVGSDFDNMMAKIIVTAATWDAAVVKARRALDDTEITGVKTNLDLLRAIVADPDFAAGEATTNWLEHKMDALVESGKTLGRQVEMANSSLPPLSLASNGASAVGNSSVMLRKGDAWDVKLQKMEDKTSTQPAAHHLRIEKISRNEFPEALVAEVSFTTPGTKPQGYRMTVNSTTSSADAASSSHRRGDPGNKSHIILPMSGKLIEVLVDVGDEIQENQVIGFVKQMKMELEIRSPRAGTVGWAIELENDEGDDVAEGVLLAELEPVEASVAVRSRL
jgi:pyruvate carboxylase